ncbi:hypothetical protein [Lacticaseibacillus camelliae]|uniref:hypothetical protein n=1 Tax=Lacticaseibacillus camelliae TaxID=381742 RepID=UPI000A704EB1|nr:hypothetical protein [Lacticaseibacillus camelliae]
MSLTTSALLALVLLGALTGATTWLVKSRIIRHILLVIAAILAIALVAVLIKSLM